MRRTIAALVILFLIFAMWFTEMKILNRVCHEVISKAENMEETIKEGADLLKVREDFFQNWEKTERILDIISPHDETDEINILAVRVKRALDINDINSALLNLLEIKEHIREIMRKSKVDVSTVF